MEPQEVQPSQEDPAIRLHLYVAGDSPRSQRALANLDRLVGRLPAGTCEVEIVDVLTAPERLEVERILATPTLIRTVPQPRRRVTGDLSDVAAVMEAMGMLGVAER